MYHAVLPATNNNVVAGGGRERVRDMRVAVWIDMRVRGDTAWHWKFVSVEWDWVVRIG